MSRAAIVPVLVLATMAAAPGSGAPQTSSRIAVWLEASEARPGARRLHVRNDYTFPIETIQLAWGDDPGDPDDELDLDYFHALDGRETPPGERPIAPGEVRVFDLAGRTSSSARAWLRLALFTDRTWVGEDEAGEVRLRKRRNEAADLEYWMGVLGNHLNVPARQARRVLEDRLTDRRDLSRGGYDTVTDRLREIRALIRTDDADLHAAMEARLDEYTRLQELAAREFRRVRDVFPRFGAGPH